MSVDKILFCAATQRIFLNDILNAIQEINSNENIKDPIPLFGSSKSFAVDNPPVRTTRETIPITNIASIIAGDNDICTNTVTPTGLDGAITFMKWVIFTPDINPLIITWAVLLSLYLSDTAKDVVCALTTPHIARAYLENFNERFETYLCGELKHNKSHKRSDLIRQAKSPTEIVLHEWIYAKQLYTGLAEQI